MNLRLKDREAVHAYQHVSIGVNFQQVTVLRIEPQTATT